ncbi:hypothetical protein AEM42_14175 [Betaproteobacteria bacterium UKL13-2]|nr:hypothetical protein AEM42_14175 [Betaproteobacteria bacterium UKL13-2]HCG53213.1 hypothetical protein [Betaproteobacteria bacterium]
MKSNDGNAAALASALFSDGSAILIAQHRQLRWPRVLRPRSGSARDALLLLRGYVKKLHLGVARGECLY